MGLIKAAMGSIGGVLSDQWKEYFYCDALPESILVIRGKKRTARGGNRGSDNIISSGSVIAVADGQCMLIVEQGKIVEVCAEPGEFVFDASTEPSVFAGGLNKESIMETLANVGKRFTFGGEAPKDQRVYYVNTRELMGNKYGTPSPVPFRVVDQNIGLDMDISLRCFGEYSYRISNPLLFYTNVCANVSDEFERTRIDNQLKTEILTALQPAFARISEMGIRYSALPGHTMELSETMNQVLSAKWKDLRGLEIVSFGVSSVKANEEDERAIKELQRNAAFRNPTMAAAHLVGAQAAAMQSAASNQSAGPAMAFMGMNMAGNMGGMNAQDLFRMGAQQNMQQQNMQQQNMQQNMQQQNYQQRPQQSAPKGGWTCPSCGQSGITGNFCPECGTKKPAPAAPADAWTCPSCGTANKGKFCLECGTRKPAGIPQYRCDKCGWEPADPSKPPRFCPECGDPFGDEDRIG